jgi:hypothetical protein
VRFEAPGEREAGERAWELVRVAYAEREPVAWPRRHARPLIAGALVAAAVAATLSPPGRSVVRELRKSVGIEHARPALFSLPAPGKLLVTSRQGAWLVQSDGSKRLLGSYRDAAFSPFGRFVVATRANELVALDPKGEVRWTLARPRPRFPVWTGTRTDTRIAYLSAGRLRVVAGDGTGDHAIGPATLRHLRRLARGDTRIRVRRGQSEVLVRGRIVFRGTGVFDRVVASPDRRWLLVSWPTANQWVFVRLQPRKIVGVARITQQFGRDPRVAGWCCA